MRRLLLVLAAVFLTFDTSVAGPDLLTSQPIDQAVFGFGGAVFKRIDPPTEGFEDNYVLGGGYQLLWGDRDGYQIGLEAGLAGRFGEISSLEGWAGVVGRSNFQLGVVRVTPALTFGLSAVTDTMAGGETRREEQYDGDASLLFYLGPELNFGLEDLPDTELFVRMHHRSGAWGTLGNIHGAADVLTLGVRYHF